MKKIIVLLSVVFILVSCGTPEIVFELNNENVESSYIKENRSLNLENRKLSHFVNLNEFMKDTEINNIFVGNNNIQMIDVSSFDKLGKLEVNNNNIRFIGDLRLPKDIRHLNLSNNQLTSLKGIEKFTKLKTLDISNNNIEEKDIILKGLKDLIFINVEGNNISDEFRTTINKFNYKFLYKNKNPYGD